MRGIVDAVIPIAADIVIGFELVVGDAVRAERLGDAEPDRSGTDHSDLVPTVLHPPSLRQATAGSSSAATSADPHRSDKS